MTPLSVVLYTCLTVGFLVAIFAIIYYVTTARNIKKQRERMPELFNDLKPGMRIVFAGGLIGTLVNKDSDNIFAKVKLNDNTVVEVAVYSISNIIDK
ncbi:preprotein translocase subunit YajC [Erysipelothrix sp. HDW6C]|uniref:preprotein translocase subunit YajC n=1 Tax=Erysipelothrix sp. HDW6C TaxID=2714930 RepID=UPI00140A0228|nr:preprotein translocase subunit YajC [Erysipelothrix sp. HDW6C]QIK69250.1 preprotein translocase subunit YajC [Erysipelothrix sp. HDW6C]